IHNVQNGDFMSSETTALGRGLMILLLLNCWVVCAPAAEPARSEEYSTCKTWKEVVEGENLRYAQIIRVSDPGTKERPVYTGFWFFEGFQFDESGRYALAMKVNFKERNVKSDDRGEIGYIDLKDNNKWTKIGETTAWNWQQGCRLTWRGNSNEI